MGAPAFLIMPESREKPSRKGHVAVRLDPVTIARLDALLSLYSLPGRLPTRSDGLRAVILAGLEVEERRAPTQASTAPMPPLPPGTSDAEPDD